MWEHLPPELQDKIVGYVHWDSWRNKISRVNLEIFSRVETVGTVTHGNWIFLDRTFTWSRPNHTLWSLESIHPRDIVTTVAALVTSFDKVAICRNSRHMNVSTIRTLSSVAGPELQLLSPCYVVGLATKTAQ